MFSRQNRKLLKGNRHLGQKAGFKEACLSIYLKVNPVKIGLLVLFALFLSVNTVVLQSTSVSASMTASTSPDERAKAYSNYKVAYKCVQSHLKATIRTIPEDDGKTSPSQGDKGLKAGSIGSKYDYEWFADHDAWGVVYPAGKQDCYQIMNTMLQLTSLDGGAMLRSLGYRYDSNLPGYINTGRKEEKLKETVLAKVGNVNTLNTDDSKHLLYLRAFSNSTFGSCEAVQKSKYSEASKTIKDWTDSESNNIQGELTYVKVNMVEGSSVVPYIYTYKADTSSSHATITNRGSVYSYRGAVSSSSSDTTESYTCSDLAKKVSSTASALAAWNSKNTDKQVDSSTDGSTTDTTTDDAAPTCVIDGVGWLLCPIMEFLGGVTDQAYNAVEGLLKTPPLLTQGDTSGTYQAWKVMQGFANATFVVVFIVIIYSQLTSTGVSNYGVKRMLPRLIIGALLVNVSFFICAIAVDISNIVGSSIKPLLDNITIPQATVDGVGDFDVTPGGAGIFGPIIAYVLAGAGAAAGIAFLSNATLLAALAVLVPGILAAIAAILTVLIVLTLRQALIILLVVVSPLAFVAFLLPNTENLFTKWRKLFTTLLLMFPIIAGIFGVSALAATIVMNSAQGNFLVQIAGALITIIPLAITPIVMKTAGGVLSRVGAFTNNKQKGLFDRANNAAAGFRKNQGDLRALRALNGERKGLNGSFTRMRARRGAVNQGRKSELARAQASYISTHANENDEYADLMAGGSAFGVSAAEGAAGRAQARATSTLARLDKEDLDGATVKLTAKIDKAKLAGKNPDTELMNAFSSGGSSMESKAAINMLAAQGRDKAIRELQSSASPAQKEVIQDAITSNAGALVGKAPDLVKGAGGAFSSMDGKTLTGLSSDTAKEYIKHMGDLFSTASAAGASDKEKKAFNDAMSSFSNSIEDIRRDPGLQGSFKGDAGQAIMDAFKDSGIAGFNAYKPSSIDASGKIR